MECVLLCRTGRKLLPQATAASRAGCDATGCPALLILDYRSASLFALEATCVLGLVLSACKGCAQRHSMRALPQHHVCFTCVELFAPYTCDYCFPSPFDGRPTGLAQLHAPSHHARNEAHA